jgi:hypothetical protein
VGPDLFIKTRREKAPDGQKRQPHVFYKNPRIRMRHPRPSREDIRGNTPGIMPLNFPSLGKCPDYEHNHVTKPELPSEFDDSESSLPLFLRDPSFFKCTSVQVRATLGDKNALLIEALKHIATGTFKDEVDANIAVKQELIVLIELVKANLLIRGKLLARSTRYHRVLAAFHKPCEALHKCLTYASISRKLKPLSAKLRKRISMCAARTFVCDANHDAYNMQIEHYLRFLHMFQSLPSVTPPAPSAAPTEEYKQYDDWSSSPSRSGMASPDGSPFGTEDGYRSDDDYDDCSYFKMPHPFPANWHNPNTYHGVLFPPTPVGCGRKGPDRKVFLSYHPRVLLPGTGPSAAIPTCPGPRRRPRLHKTKHGSTQIPLYQRFQSVLPAHSGPVTNAALVFASGLDSIPSNKPFHPCPGAHRSCPAIFNVAHWGDAAWQNYFAHSATCEHIKCTLCDHMGHAAFRCPRHLCNVCYRRGHLASVCGLFEHDRVPYITAQPPNSTVPPPPAATTTPPPNAAVPSPNKNPSNNLSGGPPPVPTLPAPRTHQRPCSLHLIEGAVYMMSSQTFMNFPNTTPTDTGPESTSNPNSNHGGNFLFNSSYSPTEPAGAPHAPPVLRAVPAEPPVATQAPQAVRPQLPPKACRFCRTIYELGEDYKSHTTKCQMAQNRQKGCVQYNKGCHSIFEYSTAAGRTAYWLHMANCPTLDCTKCKQSGHVKLMCPQTKCYRCTRLGHCSYACQALQPQPALPPQQPRSTFLHAEPPTGTGSKRKRKSKLNNADNTRSKSKAPASGEQDVTHQPHQHNYATPTSAVANNTRSSLSAMLLPGLGPCSHRSTTPRLVAVPVGAAFLPGITIPGPVPRVGESPPSVAPKIHRAAPGTAMEALSVPIRPARRHNLSNAAILQNDFDDSSENSPDTESFDLTCYEDARSPSEEANTVKTSTYSPQRLRKLPNEKEAPPPHAQAMPVPDCPQALTLPVEPSVDTPQEYAPMISLYVPPRLGFRPLNALLIPPMPTGFDDAGNYIKATIVPVWCDNSERYLSPMLLRAHLSWDESIHIHYQGLGHNKLIRTGPHVCTDNCHNDALTSFLETSKDWPYVNVPVVGVLNNAVLRVRARHTKFQDIVMHFGFHTIRLELRVQPWLGSLPACDAIRTSATIAVLPASAADSTPAPGGSPLQVPAAEPLVPPPGACPLAPRDESGYAPSGGAASSPPQGNSVTTRSKTAKSKAPSSSGTKQAPAKKTKVSSKTQAAAPSSATPTPSPTVTSGAITPAAIAPASTSVTPPSAQATTATNMTTPSTYDVAIGSTPHTVPWAPGTAPSPGSTTSTTSSAPSIVSTPTPPGTVPLGLGNMFGPSGLTTSAGSSSSSCSSAPSATPGTSNNSDGAPGSAPPINTEGLCFNNQGHQQQFTPSQGIFIPPPKSPCDPGNNDGDPGDDEDSTDSPSDDDDEGCRLALQKLQIREKVMNDKLLTAFSSLVEATSKSKDRVLKTTLAPYDGASKATHGDLYAFLMEYLTHTAGCKLRDVITKFPSFVSGPAYFKTHVTIEVHKYLNRPDHLLNWDKFMSIILQTAVSGNPWIIYGNKFKTQPPNDPKNPDGLRLLLNDLKKFADITNLFADATNKITERAVVEQFVYLLMPPDVAQFFRMELARGGVYTYITLDNIVALYFSSLGLRTPRMSQIAAHFVGSVPHCVPTSNTYSAIDGTPGVYALSRREADEHEEIVKNTKAKLVRSLNNKNNRKRTDPVAQEEIASDSSDIEEISTPAKPPKRPRLQAFIRPRSQQTRHPEGCRFCREQYAPTEDFNSHAANCQMAQNQHKGCVRYNRGCQAIFKFGTEDGKLAYWLHLADCTALGCTLCKQAGHVNLMCPAAQCYRCSRFGHCTYACELLQPGPNSTPTPGSTPNTTRRPTTRNHNLHPGLSFAPPSAPHGSGPNIPDAKYSAEHYHTNRTHHTVSTRRQAPRKPRNARQRANSAPTRVQQHNNPPTWLNTKPPLGRGHDRPTPNNKPPSITLQQQPAHSPNPECLPVSREVINKCPASTTSNPHAAEDNWLGHPNHCGLQHLAVTSNNMQQKSSIFEPTP